MGHAVGALWQRAELPATRNCRCTSLLTGRLAAAQRVGAAPPGIIPPHPAFALPQVELTRLLSSGRMDYNTVQQLATPELVRGESTGV